MKKFICILTAAVFLFCINGCGMSAPETGSQIEDSDSSKEDTAVHKIGVAVYDVSDDEVIAFRDYLTDYIKKCFPEVEF
ncbi:MAG TPA: hypothetical protein DD414_12225, partial [Lachnospiraceae bacterium]|nr:hypothetical protein [Lachnospiraceae bacterium]